MRTVRARTWREIIGSDETRQVHRAYRKYAYFARRRYFNRISLLAAITLVAGLIGLEHRPALVVFFSLVAFTAYLYLLAKARAEGLELKRVAPAKAIELEDVEIGIEIFNRGAFAVRDVLLSDAFEGSRVSRQAIWVDEAIPPRGAESRRYRKRCDAGMGAFGFAPLTAVVSDPLGVFEFVVTEDRPTRVEVYPKLEPIPQVRMPGSKESFLYGIYDLPTRGASVNFSGIRDFTRGDSLKHVAWRLSSKHRRILVKQFEKIANTEITVLLNMNALDHAGRKSESTWEYAKDAALALVSQQMANGNSIQLFSNEKSIRWGRGEEHANAIARAVFDLVPVDRGASRNLIDSFLGEIPSGSTAVFVGPILETDPDAFLRSLLRLKVKDVNVVCVLVRAVGFLEGKVHGDARFLVESSAWKNESRLDRLVKRIRAEGMSAYMLDCGREIGRSLL